MFLFDIKSSFCSTPLKNNCAGAEGEIWTRNPCGNTVLNLCPAPSFALVLGVRAPHYWWAWEELNLHEIALTALWTLRVCHSTTRPQKYGVNIPIPPFAHSIWILNQELWIMVWDACFHFMIHNSVFMIRQKAYGFLTRFSFIYHCPIVSKREYTCVPVIGTMPLTFDLTEKLYSVGT